MLAYVDALMRRYSNTEIRHRTWQIAMDGSQKLPQRILQTVRERMNRNLSIAHLALVVAAWIRYMRGIDEAGEAIDVRDPFAADLKAAIGRAGNSAGEVSAAVVVCGNFWGFIQGAHLQSPSLQLTNGCEMRARGAPPLARKWTNLMEQA